MAVCTDCRAACTGLRGGHLPRIDSSLPATVATKPPFMKHVVQSLTAQGCDVLARAWHVHLGFTHLGVGDLVVRLPCGTHLVIHVGFTLFLHESCDGAH